MLHRPKFALLVLFCVCGLAITSSAKAEHIFLRASVNDVFLDPQSDSEASLQALNPTIIAPDGTFTFVYQVFNTTNPFGASDGLSVDFSSPDGDSNTLPKPTSQSFTYQGTGTETNPEVFVFTQKYDIAGVYSGSLSVSFHSESFIINFPCTLVSTVATPTPEPATIILLGSGLSGLIGFGLKKRKR